MIEKQRQDLTLSLQNIGRWDRVGGGAAAAAASESDDGDFSSLIAGDGTSRAIRQHNRD